MLIGPTITLDVLEKHMSDKHYENKMELGKLRRMLQSLSEEIKRLPVKVMIEKEGKEVEGSHPSLEVLPSQLRDTEASILATETQQIFLEEKLRELGSVEEQAKQRGLAFNKAEQKITLSLRDCVNFGIHPDSLETSPS